MRAATGFMQWWNCNDKFYNILIYSHYNMYNSDKMIMKNNTKTSLAR